METFDVAPIDGFNPTLALERMLKLLLTLFDEVTANKSHLLISADHDAISNDLGEAYQQALVIARDDTHDLLRLLQTVDFSLSEKEYLRLSGPSLRFKMMAIKMALGEANAVHPERGLSARRGWALYRRALITVFEVMDTPLWTLSLMVDGPRGAIAFKQDIQALMAVRSGSAS